MKNLLLILFHLLVLSPAARSTDLLPARVYHWIDIAADKKDPGEARLVFSGSTTYLKNFEVYVMQLEAKKTSLSHQASTGDEELVIVKEGKIGATINGTEKILGPGSIEFFMPGDQYKIEAAGPGSATCYIFTYHGKIANPGRGREAGGSFMLDWNDLPTSTTGKGYRRDFFNRATSQLARFEMHTTALNVVAVSHSPHTHVKEEIVLILRGNVTMHIGNDFLPASSGDLVFLPSGVPHALNNTGKESCEYFAFQWRN